MENFAAAVRTLLPVWRDDLSLPGSLYLGRWKGMGVIDVFAFEMGPLSNVLSLSLSAVAQAGVPVCAFLLRSLGRLNKQVCRYDYQHPYHVYCLLKREYGDHAHLTKLPPLERSRMVMQSAASKRFRGFTVDGCRSFRFRVGGVRGT